MAEIYCIIENDDAGDIWWGEESDTTFRNMFQENNIPLLLDIKWI